MIFILDTLGERIKHVRKDKGLTQKEFADKLGIARSTLAGYETNQITPSVNIVFKMAKEFDIPPIYFLRVMMVKLDMNENDYGTVNIIHELSKLQDRLETQDLFINGQIVESKSQLSELVNFTLEQTKKTIIQLFDTLEKGKSS